MLVRDDGERERGGDRAVQRIFQIVIADVSMSLDNVLAVAGGAPVVLSPATNSLNDIRDAINAAGLAVTASIVSDGSATGQRLVVSGKDTGAAHAITLAGTGALAAFSYDPAAPVNFGYDGSGNAPATMSQTQAAQDAQLTIDGVKVYDGGECASFATSARSGPPLAQDMKWIDRLLPKQFILFHPVVLVGRNGVPHVARAG